MERFKRRAKVAAAAVSAAAVLALVPAGSAVGKISPANCTNNGGNTPGGQQPVCTGGGLTQNPATNPAGNAPPGQQP
jgi:hypothetical protein